MSHEFAPQRSKSLTLETYTLYVNNDWTKKLSAHYKPKHHWYKVCDITRPVVLQPRDQ